VSRRIRWRFCIAWYALVALAWPSLGLLPWVLDLPTDPVAAHASTHIALESSSTPHDHDHAGDASDIPGSPTHPADHDCFQCQVLKHLARCAVAPLDLPAIGLPSGDAVQPCVVGETQFVGHVAALPPVRAPPLHRA
jgi:hypothetical protein